MSKQRALELCEEALQSNGGHAEYYGIVKLSQAICELAMDEKFHVEQPTRVLVAKAIMEHMEHNKTVTETVNRIMEVVNDQR